MQESPGSGDLYSAVDSPSASDWPINLTLDDIEPQMGYEDLASISLEPFELSPNLVGFAPLPQSRGRILTSSPITSHPDKFSSDFWPNELGHQSKLGEWI